MCLRAEYFGVNTKRKNPFFAPLRPKGHMCFSAEYFYIPGYFGVNTKRGNPFRAPLRPKGHMCFSVGYFIRAEYYNIIGQFVRGGSAPTPLVF